MKQVLLIAHGQLAYEMKNSAEMIFGELTNVYPIAFLKEEGLDTIKEKITTEMCVEANEYLILTDLFGGTSYNASCAIAMTYPNQTIEVISGMSLPLMLEVASLLPTQTVTEVANYLPTIATQMVQSFKQQVIQEEEEL